MSQTRRSRPVPAVHGCPEPENASTGQPGALESTSVAFVIPGKPVSTNQTYRTGRSGRWFKDPEAASWQGRVAIRARIAMKGRSQFTGDVEVWIRFWFDSRRPDVDGPVKGLLDRLAPSVIQNDRQVVAYHVTKLLDRENPRTEVEVRPWAPVVERVMDEAQLAERFRRWVHEHDDGEGA